MTIDKELAYRWYYTVLSGNYGFFVIGLDYIYIYIYITLVILDIDAYFSGVSVVAIFGEKFDVAGLLL